MANDDIANTRLNAIMEQNPKVALALDHIAEGNYNDAAALLIEHQREQLPDGHPSKEVREPRQLEGAEVSQIYKFEELSGAITDGAKFFAIAIKLGREPELMNKCLLEYFMYMRRHDMGNFADFAIRFEALSQDPNAVYPWRPTADSGGE